MNDSDPPEKRIKPEDYLQITPEIEQKICDLVRAEKITEAVELYCIKKDCGIGEAQDGVHEIAVKHGLRIHKQTKMGCSTVILILICLVTLCLFLVIYLADHFNF